MPKSPAPKGVGRHTVERAIKNVGHAIAAAGAPSLSQEYLVKLRTICLRQAQAQQPNASPDEVVCEADQRYRNCLNFLNVGQS